jgi:hypothetical protein
MMLRMSIDGSSYTLIELVTSIPFDWNMKTLWSSIKIVELPNQTFYCAPLMYECAIHGVRLELTYTNPFASCIIEDVSKVENLITKHPIYDQTLDLFTNRLMTTHQCTRRGTIEEPSCDRLDTWWGKKNSEQSLGSVLLHMLWKVRGFSLVL